MTQSHRAVPAAAALGAVVPLLFWGLDGSYGGPLIGVIGAAVLLLALRLQALPDDFWRRASLPILFIFIGLGWASLASLGGGLIGAASLVPDLWAGELAGAAGAICMLLAGAWLGCSSRSRTATLRMLIAFAIIPFVIGMANSFFPDSDFVTIWPDGQQGRFAGTLGNANVAAAFFGAMSVLALEQILARRPASPARADRLWRLAAGLCLALALPGLVATESRMGITATFAALVLLAATRASRPQRWKLAGVFAAIAILVWMIAPSLSDTRLHRFDGIFADLAARREMWSHYADLALAEPLFGYGLGAFPSLNLAAISTPGQAGALWSVNSAHNVALQLWLDGGLPYLLAIGLAAGLIAWTAWRSRARGPLLAVVTVFACAWVDIALDVPGMVGFTMLLAGLAWGAGLRQIAHAKRAPLQHERSVRRT